MNEKSVRLINEFNNSWKFHFGDIQDAHKIDFNDSNWRILNLSHDGSIEGEFNPEHPATPGGGALPGGTGWYRKEFQIPDSWKGSHVFIDFDGIYHNSSVCINEHFLGFRPYGYCSFRYELTPYLKYGNEKNIIAVKVDNSQQPNFRWYSGSGIYRNVWLIKTANVYVEHWGTLINTPDVDSSRAKICVQLKIRNASNDRKYISLTNSIFNQEGKKVAEKKTENIEISQGQQKK